MIGRKRNFPFSFPFHANGLQKVENVCVMKILENSLLVGIFSMAMKRLLKWATWESNRFKYLVLWRNFSCTFRFNSHNRIEMVTLQPKTAYMRKESDNSHFNISIMVDYPPLGLNKTLHLRRPLESSLMLLLQRINLKLYAHMEKMKNKKKNNLTVTEFPPVNALLYLNENQLSDDTVCSEIFELNGKLVLRIYNDSYLVRCNCPWINSLGLPKNIKTNMIIHPLKFESNYCDVEKSSFTWFKSDQSTHGPKTFVFHIKQWVEIGQGFFYNVSENDAGHYLKLECVPKNDKESGPAFSELTFSPVEIGECNYYYLNTHKLTKESAGENKLRIITYNVLAAMYTNTKEAKAMFDYCPVVAIEKSQRFSAISCEIAGYNGDLICLQEVELFNFERYLMPQLKGLGYTGLICLKSQDKEGTACILNKNKFNILGTQNYIFSHEVTTNSRLGDILNYVKQKEEFFQKFISLPHAIQLVALRSTEKKNEALIVGNVHLYSSPEADLIRLLQVLSSFGLFQTFVEYLGTLLENLNTTFILCGDFNSTPECSINELIMNGSLSSDHSIWESEEMKGYKGLSFNLPVKMGNAYGTPKFTNYTRLFKGCLDYIYYQTDRLEVDKTYPLASEDELSENVGLPSVSFPSDHVPLIVDMKWKC